MPAARDWEDTIRAVVSHALSQRGCRRGLTVLNHRGHARLNIAAGAGRGRRRQVLLPIPWECDQIDQIRDAVVQVYEEFQQGIEPDACVARMPRADGSRGAEGEAAAGRSPHTGHPGRPRHRGWGRCLPGGLGRRARCRGSGAPPQNAKQLLESLARIWADKPGGRTRQIQIQSTAALLCWAVAERRLGEDWEPPQDLAVFVGRSRAAKAIPDALWRFAFQLMATYRLRPEELQHLQIRQRALVHVREGRLPRQDPTKGVAAAALRRLGRRLVPGGTLPNPGASAYAAWAGWWLRRPRPDESTGSGRSYGVSTRPRARSSCLTLAGIATHTAHT